MPKYRRRTSEFEAWQYMPQVGTDCDMAICTTWIIDAMNSGRIAPQADGSLLVTTPGGNFTCQIGDWILLGVAGALQLSKNELFDMIYERVPDVASV